MNAAELEYMVAYQIGALQAMAAYADLPVTHLKAHGALSNMAAVDESYAMAIGQAIKAVDPRLIYVAHAGSQMQKAAERLGLRLAREGYCDRRYSDDGNLAPRALPGTVLRDPAAATEQALRLVLEKEVVAVSGKVIKVEIDTLCVHGDEPTAIVVAGAVKAGLEGAGIRVATLPELIA
jgi:5-oxoprolinase (ATP-hydrolysing) subunit A